MAKLSERMQLELSQSAPTPEREDSPTGDGRDSRAEKLANPVSSENPGVCMLCGIASDASTAGPFCQSCWKRSNETIRYCPKCLKMFGGGFEHCSQCGGNVVESDSRPISVALGLMLGVDRFAEPTSTLNCRSALDGLGVKANDPSRWQLNEEIRWSGMFCTSVILRQRSAPACPDPAGIYRIMEDLYRRNLEERRIEADLMNLFVQEYDATAEFYREALTGCLNETQTEDINCLTPLVKATGTMWFPAIKDAKLDLAVALDLGFMLRVQGQILDKAIGGDSADE
jgi:hypothetical protein